MRRILIAPLALIVFLVLAGWAVLQTQSFWRWGGWEVVNIAQDRLYPELRVGAVQGQPFTGFTFTDVTLTGPQGEILHTDKLELRFSLWSFLQLQPVIATIALHEPRLTLRQDRESRWEVANLLKKRPPPPFKSLDWLKDLQADTPQENPLQDRDEIARWEQIRHGLYRYRRHIFNCKYESGQ